MSILVDIILPIFGLVFLGYGMVRAGIFDDRVIDGLDPVRVQSRAAGPPVPDPCRDRSARVDPLVISPCLLSCNLPDLCGWYGDCPEAFGTIRRRRHRQCSA